MRIYSGKRNKGRVVEGDIHDYHGLKMVKKRDRSLKRSERQEIRQELRNSIQSKPTTQGE